MKKLFILLVALLLLTACSSSNKELEKFKKYLITNLGYECEENVCTLTKIRDNDEFIEQYNFNSKTRTEKRTSNSAIGETINMSIYNWDKDTGTYERNYGSAKIKVEYNFKTEKYSIKYETEISETTKQYVEKNYNSYLESIKATKSEIELMKKVSGTKYFK